jgi:hypothetical protein
MPFATVLHQQRNDLLQSFKLATIRGLTTTWKRCAELGTTPQEADFVAGLTQFSTPLIYSTLNTILSSALPGFALSLSAVFCHQKPEVVFNHAGHRAACELGDILFAHIHTPLVGSVRHNAILFQAKATAHQPYLIRGDEAKQLHLYTEWPDFTYSRSTFLNGQRRSVTPKAPHAGAQYLLIDNRPPTDPQSGLLGLPGTYPVGCCMPEQELLDHSELSEELFDLLTFRTGRPFSTRGVASGTDQWSQVVWDILEYGIKRAFTRRNSGRHNEPRGSSTLVSMMDGNCFARSSAFSAASTVMDIIGEADAARRWYEGESDRGEENGSEHGHEPDPSGVSLVLIETAELAGEGRNR